MLGHRSNRISKQCGFSDAGKRRRMQKQKAPAQFSLNRGLRLSANSLISDETYQNPSGPLSASQLDEVKKRSGPSSRDPEIRDEESCLLPKQVVLPFLLERR